MNQPRFDILVLEEAREFLKSMPEHVRNKIYYNIRKVQYGVNDPELFKKLENSNIWEFRTKYQRGGYRLFAFWDTVNNSFVATHGIVKKSQKTPSKEIDKAEKIRKKYLSTND